MPARTAAHNQRTQTRRQEKKEDGEMLGAVRKPRMQKRRKGRGVQRRVCVDGAAWLSCRPRWQSMSITALSLSLSVHPSPALLQCAHLLRWRDLYPALAPSTLLFTSVGAVGLMLFSRIQPSHGRPSSRRNYLVVLGTFMGVFGTTIELYHCPPSPTIESR